ncbi:MAG: phosphatase PAP2 family protein [Planctomycetes bacterium]|nr:phosphatase PAP2 family protein [Planctomycetota bacterium]
MNFLRRNFFAQDILYLGFVGALLLWTIVASFGLPHYIHSTPGGYHWARQPLPTLALYFAGLIAAYLLLQRGALAHHRKMASGKPSSKALTALNFVFSLSPLVLVPTVFQLLGAFIAGVSGAPNPSAHPAFDPAASYDPAATWWDLELRALEVRLLGVYLPQAVRDYQQPWLTGVLMWLYVGYYLSPGVAVLPPLFRGQWKLVREGSALAMTCLFLTYLGHILIPATSPRAFGGPEAWLPVEPGWFGAETVARFINSVEVIRWDAFPSGHTAMGLVCLVFALKHQRVIGLAYAPCVAGVIAATIYLGYHHAIDVVVGIAIVPVVFLIAGPIIRWWDGTVKPEPTV